MRLSQVYFPRAVTRPRVRATVPDCIMSFLVAAVEEQQSAEWLIRFQKDYSPDLPKLKKARTEVMKVCVHLRYVHVYLCCNFISDCDKGL